MAKMVAIFKRENWFFASYDGRKKIFRGITKEEFETAKDKHYERYWAQVRANVAIDKAQNVKRYMKLKKYFESIPYQYQGDGMDDFNKFQRPASSGGYVAICPGEKGNNVYIEPTPENAHIIAHLKRLYNENTK